MFILLPKLGMIWFQWQDMIWFQWKILTFHSSNFTYTLQPELYQGYIYLLIEIYSIALQNEHYKSVLWNCILETVFVGHLILTFNSINSAMQLE